MMVISKNSYYEKKAKLCFERIENEGGILYDEEERATHLMNCTATLIWELITEDHNVQKILDLYLKSFDFDQKDLKEIKDDFFETITVFLEKKLIREIKL